MMKRVNDFQSFTPEVCVCAADTNSICAKGSAEMGIKMEAILDFKDFRLNADGLIPIIVQDYSSQEVLMLAYMNQEAYEATMATGKMTYFSRSKKRLWVKGEESGHFQHVKSLYLDCDNDTILAKVAQVGVACHTGSPSCFFQELVLKETLSVDSQEPQEALSTEYLEKNPLKVFEQVYAIIVDRKENPKEGSYTNYLFEKGLDKMLKKVGEEATEVVIAAKNPMNEEMKYELADLLYHLMVLMVEKGLTWEEICKELAQR